MAYVSGESLARRLGEPVRHPPGRRGVRAGQGSFYRPRNSLLIKALGFDNGLLELRRAGSPITKGGKLAGAGVLVMSPCATSRSYLLALKLLARLLAAFSNSSCNRFLVRDCLSMSSVVRRMPWRSRQAAAEC